MWVFTLDGFYSVVAFRGKQDRVLVRARAEKDIARVSKILGEHYGVTDDGSADYPYRMSTTKEKWGEYLKNAVLNMDYDNFKNAALKGSDVLGPRGQAYFDVWATMVDLEVEDNYE